MLRYWLYPANIKLYDVISAFNTEEKIAWPISSKVEVGDYVLMYIGSPVQQIVFQCEVIEVNIPMERVMSQGEKYMKGKKKEVKKRNFMFLKNLKTLEQNPDSPLAFKHLKLNGLNGSLMGPRCLNNNEQLMNYILPLIE